MSDEKDPNEKAMQAGENMPVNPGNSLESEVVDLSILEGFNFGPKWGGAKKGEGKSSFQPRQERSFGENRRPRDGNNRGAPRTGGGARGFSGQTDRRPQGQGERRFDGGQGRPQGERKFGGPSGERRFPSPGQGQGPRQFGEQSGERRGYAGKRPMHGGNRRPPFHREPEPTVDVDFYPEDAPFTALTKAIRATCRTYELFEVAQLILQKPDRFVIVVKHKEKDKKFFVSAFDGMPFDTEEEAVSYGLKHHIQNFFDIEDVELEAPKGSFPMINKCGFTGELLGPPNYHRYQELLKQHHQSQLGHMPFEKFTAKIESSKDPELAAAWLEKMKKGKKYTLKNVVEGTEPLVFNAWENVRAYMLAHHKKELFKVKDQIRISGTDIEKVKGGELKSAIERRLREQREFPLQTANNLRGRLRRMNFAIYKRKDRKGASFVSSVKRKNKDSSTAFTEPLRKLIEFIEANDGVLVTELAYKFLGLELPKSTETETTDTPKAVLSQEQQVEIKKVLMDLRWLVSEGYVTEFGDGKLSANSVKDEDEPATKKKTEAPIDFEKEKAAAAVVSTAIEEKPSEEEIEIQLEESEGGIVLDEEE